jgi:hypothetical protein
MSVSPKTLLLASSLAAIVAIPCFVGIGDAQAQTASALTPYPACSVKPTPQDSEAAHSAYLLGKRFFEESDYGSASHNFIDAFKLDCTKPELLLNIARANELLGNRAEAVHALETYLQRGQGLGPDDKTQLQRRIDNLKAAIAAQVAASAPVPTVATPIPSTVAPVPTPAPTTIVPPPPPATDDRQHTITPWIVTGVGGAAAIAGGVMYLVGSGDVSSAKKTCPVSTKCPVASAISQGNTGDTLESAGSVTFFVGLAAVAGGVLWHFLEPTGPASGSPSKASFTPVVGPGYSGASVVGRF